MPSERKPTTGNSAELLAMLRCSQRGWFVSIPVGGKAAYDFIADSRAKLMRVQVKTIHQARTDNGVKWVVDFMKPRGTKGRIKYRHYTLDDCDFVVAVCVEFTKCFVFPVSVVSSKRQATFYFDANAPAMARGCGWVNEYLEAWE